MMSNSPIAARRSFLAKVFISPTERRLRAGWRLLLQVLLQTVLLTILGVMLVAFLPGLITGAPAGFNKSELVSSQIAELIAITLSVLLARRLLDRRSFGSLGLRPGRAAVLDFGAGLAITFLMMASIFGLELLLGWLSVSGFAWQEQTGSQVSLGVLVFLVVCLFVGWNEELMSRGYHLQTIASGTSMFWGWIISSSVFGLLHLSNPHANWLAAAGVVLAGLFLGFAYIRTGQLWLSMGLHTGWNFFEGVVFGFPVSGLPFYRLTHTSVSGPVLWTGGEFGPEAGLVLLPALVLGTILVHLYSKRARPS